jgi:hypothetical protein
MLATCLFSLAKWKQFTSVPFVATAWHPCCYFHETRRCLLSKCYSASAQLVEEDIFDVDPSKSACTPQDLLLYSYYGGMLCIGQ